MKTYCPKLTIAHLLFLFFHVCFCFNLFKMMDAYDIQSAALCLSLLNFRNIIYIIPIHSSGAS